MKIPETSESAFLMSILKSISDGVMVAGRDGRILMMNPAAERITGISNTTEPYDSWSQLFGCYLSEEMTPYPTEELPLVRALRGEVTSQMDMFLKNPNLPHPVWISISGRPLEQIEAGGMSGGVIIFRDITERKRIEADLRRAHEEAQEFAYVAAHDLQEPLRTITSYLDLLSERYGDKLDAKAHKYITNASNGAKRMQTLINDLLAYSRVATDKQPSKNVDVGQIVASVIEDLKSIITASGATIEFANLPSLLTDEVRLAQVFRNLIGNSIKYRNGPPVISVSAVKKGTAWNFQSKIMA